MWCYRWIEVGGAATKKFLGKLFAFYDLAIIFDGQQMGQQAVVAPLPREWLEAAWPA